MKEIEVKFNAVKEPTDVELLAAVARKAGVKVQQITGYEVCKRSLDARGQQVLYRYRVKVTSGNEPPLEKFEIPEYKFVGDNSLEDTVIIVGAGPAGLFAALSLLQNGKKPIILERGKDVHSRKFDMAAMSQKGVVNPNSNYCFGEGGAGTFSDGKLYTRSNKRGDIRKVLYQFVKFGADPSILVESHAHIGSDKLPRIIENMRECIKEYGGEVYFNTHVVDFERVNGIWSVKCVNSEEELSVSDNPIGIEQAKGSESYNVKGSESYKAKGSESYNVKEYELYKSEEYKSYNVKASESYKAYNVKEQIYKIYQAPDVILATGHSARDVYELFFKKEWSIEAKGFALGVRAEHPQKLINEIQYRGKYNPKLPAAEYSLVCQVDGRGVFSFCMCPGGILVPSATSEGEMVLNGMSNSMRNSQWANAGIVVSVEPEDVPEYSKYGPLQLLRFQQDIEHKMFDFTGSIKAPAQRMDDFVNGRISKSLPKTSYAPGAVSAPLHELLPPFVASRLRKAFGEFSKKMKGYYTSNALLLAVESRTSSPVRIPRNPETLQHIGLEGLYPCGEGAGYAGGIVSSALDGINVAEQIAKV